MKSGAPCGQFRCDTISLPAAETALAGDLQGTLFLIFNQACVARERVCGKINDASFRAERGIPLALLLGKRGIPRSARNDDLAFRNSWPHAGDG